MKRVVAGIKKVFSIRTYFGSLKRTGLSLIVLIPALVFLASIGYKFYEAINPSIIYAHKLQTLTQHINKYLTLPKDETPVIATVTDTNVLPKEKFFSYAQNGDKILMYKKYKLAILYRPSTDRVITEATLEFQNTKPTPVQVPPAVAGASTSAAVSPTTQIGTPAPTSRPAPYHPQGKILVLPQQ